MTYPQQPDADLDRLHKALEGILTNQYHYRGEGRTFAYLSLIMGEMELSHKGCYLYLTDSWAEAKYVFNWLKHILPSYTDTNLKWTTHSSIETEDGSLFIFSGLDNLESRICGSRFSRIYLDLSEECWRKLKACDKVFDLHVDLNTHLLPDGDIV